MAWRSLVCGSVLAGLALADFSLYPTLDQDRLAKAFGVTAECLNALNSTVTCDSDLFGMANSVDSYMWSSDNVTALCTSDCSASAQKWSDSVKQSCANQAMNVQGKMVPVESVSGRYVDGLGIACLKADNSSSCLLESQQWVGSDIIRPDGQDDPYSDPDNTRIANLYGKDTLCSDCFVKMMHSRLSSPYLPHTEHSDYLVDEFKDIADVCSTSVAPLTTRPPPSYSAAPTPTSAASATATASSLANLTMGSNGTCAGQLITSQANKRSLSWSFARSLDFKRDSSMNITSNATSCAKCDALSEKYGVATGDLQDLIGDDECSMKAPICAPAKCVVKQIPGNTTCDMLATMASTNGMNVTLSQFLLWNPNIIGLCDSLSAGQYVCMSPAGGFANLPAPPLGSAGAANPGNRMGSGGSPTDSSDSASNSTSSSSNASGTATVSTSGASTGSSSGAPSSTAAPASTSASASAASPAPTSSSGAPAPTPSTQPGTAANCKKLATPSAGQGCEAFAQANGAAPDDLYKWNPVLGAGGKDCETKFQADMQYCVAA